MTITNEPQKYYIQMTTPIPSYVAQQSPQLEETAPVGDTATTSTDF